jgi:hypothetical protein
VTPLCPRDLVGYIYLMPTNRFAYQPLTIPAMTPNHALTAHYEHDSIRTRVQLAPHHATRGGGVPFVMDTELMTQVTLFLASCYGTANPDYRMTAGFRGLKPGESRSFTLTTEAEGQMDQKLRLFVSTSGALSVAVRDYALGPEGQPRTVALDADGGRRLLDSLVNFHLHTMQGA